LVSVAAGDEEVEGVEEVAGVGEGLYRRLKEIKGIKKEGSALNDGDAATASPEAERPPADPTEAP
jgi:hypothetical protein